MCRLLGISYGGQDEDLSTPEIASRLFYALTKGGPHAFGWMSYSDETGCIDFAKSPGRADDIDSQLWLYENIDPEARWFVGHTRYATTGSPDDNRNNHPIEHGDIIGVHNGVLKDWEPIIEKTGRHEEGTKVDSEAIFAAVNKWGPKKGLAKIHGAAVTLYANVNKPWVLHLGRTSGRSITLGWTDKGNLIWASEEEALWDLEPWITFVKFSKVSENRLLLIRDGKIIQKLTFREPEPKKITPVISSFKDMSDAEWDAYLNERKAPFTKAEKEEFSYSSLQAERAARRGAKLFPKGRPSQEQKKKAKKANKPQKPKAKKSEPEREHPYRNKDGSRKVVFHKGEFISTEQYLSKMTGG